MSDQDPFDGRIRRGLDDLSAGASHMSMPSPAGQIRHRAARRRNFAVAGVITAAMVVSGGAIVFADARDSSSIGPITQPTSTSPSATPTESATETESPSASPEPSEPPPTIPPTFEPPTMPPPLGPTVGPWPAGDPATEIPDALKLPNEGVTLGGEYTGWDTIEALDTRWEWEVCGADWYDGDSLRTDFREVRMSGFGESTHHSLAVWGVADEAVTVMSNIREAIELCPDEDTGEFVYSWQIKQLDLGGESFLAVMNTTSDGSPTTGGYGVLVVRTGAAIYALSVYADGYPTLDGGVAVEMQLQARDFTPNLCVFTMAGC